ncbi:hypothetical protein D3C72_1709140 [compost metagenome]
MAAHRAQAGARFTQLTEQQLQVGDLTYRWHRMLMLGDAHRPGADHAFGTLINRRRLTQLFLAEAGLLGDLLPGRSIDLRQIRLDADAVLTDECLIEQAGFTGRQALTMTFQQRFHHAAHGRHIPAEVGLVIG